MKISITSQQNKNTEEQQAVERYKYQRGMTTELKGDSALDNYIRGTMEIRNRKKQLEFEEDQLKELIEKTIERLLSQLKL